jgi:hypothetical protein
MTIAGLNKNPANAEGERTERTRIPMSVPRQKLSVPDIPGWHLHWMLGTPERLAQAKQAGYVFVDSEEVEVTNTSIADGSEVHGSTDLGSRVTLVAGGDMESNGQPVRLVLMKLRQEWWEADQRKLEEKSDQLAQQLRSGSINAGSDPDAAQRYVDRNRTSRNMFQRRS